MCGIAGILRVHPPGAAPPPPELAIPELWLDTLDHSIKHRGPDGPGRFRDRATRPDGSIIDIALIHRRLAIIDPAYGHQPMVWPPRAPSVSDGPHTPGTRESQLHHTPGPTQQDLIAVVFNGCIYNHRALRQELQSAGHRFETDHSDTEVLIHGWRQWGRGLFPRLEGMYAIAVWDRRRARLALATDFAGEKPLYYRDDHHTLTFASVPAAIIQAAAAMGVRLRAESHPFHRPAPIYGFVGEDGWLPVEGFRKLPPRRILEATGHSRTLHDQTSGQPLCAIGGRQRAGWPGPDHPAVPLDADRVDELIRAAVRSRLEADVPLGCFLSGGIDSSLVALHAKQAAGRLQTFCVKMPDPAYDESAIAAAVAARLGTEHATLDSEAEPAADLLDLVHRSGLPLGDSSLLPSFWVSRAAREVVRVALSGDGGDELFVGYERYRAARWLAKHGAWLRYLPTGALGSGHPKSRRARLARLVAASRGRGYPDLISIFPSEYQHALCGKALKPWQRGAGSDPVAEAIYFDVLNYLPGDLLCKVDTASMAVNLEVRAPLLDRSVVFAAMHAPIADLMPRGQRKGLLRQVARRYLPPEIVDRPKQGFAIPISEWFRTDYGGLKTLLLDHLHSSEPWGSPSLGIDLNTNFVRQILDEHMTERRDHGQRLYMLLVLSIWAKWLSTLSTRPV